MTKLLKISNLNLTINLNDGVLYPVRDLSFKINPGEIFALVGESGSGKSLTALSILQLLSNNIKIDPNSKIILNGKDLLDYSDCKMQKIRATEIAVIFQDPMQSLNPVKSIKEQLSESIIIAYKYRKIKLNKAKILAKAKDLLSKVKLKDPDKILNLYPHELSGGMKQRVVIAMALAKEPKLLIADEPTTALDVTTQAYILDLLLEIKAATNMAILLITHDLGVVKKMADIVSVMYAGQIIETSPAHEFFSNPKHPYSKLLLEALPDKASRQNLLASIPGVVPRLDHTFEKCVFLSRCNKKFAACESIKPNFNHDTQYVACNWYDARALNLLPTKIVVNKQSILDYKSKAKIDLDSNFNISNKLMSINSLKIYFPIKTGLLKRVTGYTKAVDGVDLEVYSGKTLGLVGESGSGKTTLGQSIVKLISQAKGELLFENLNILTAKRSKLLKIRQDIQYIFQDPFAAMNPRFRILDILLEGLNSLNKNLSYSEKLTKINNMLPQIGLDSNILDRYPHEFSGGQRQRIAIGRAILLEPKLIICDEPTSALDVSIQAQILNLLKKLQISHNIAYIFITHNIEVVKFMADTIAVMQEGKIIEAGDANKVLNDPEQDYTKELMRAVVRV